MFDSNSPDESISSCVPRAFLAVFDAIALGDLDTPLERCGAGLRFLRKAGLVADHHISGVLGVTEIGRELARERGFTGGMVAGNAAN